MNKEKQYIKKIVISGLKKFDNLLVEFNEGMNIIIGQNESGKSTILEAINIVINQLYRNTDKYIIKELMNRNNVNKFIENSETCNLPKIEIEIEFDLSALPKNKYFYGIEYNLIDECAIDKRVPKFGIRYECAIDEEVIDDLLPLINAGNIPYEYYNMTWKTFAGESYNSLKKSLNYLMIDNSVVDSTNSFNYYNKTIFSNTYDEVEVSKIKNDFRIKIDEVMNCLSLSPIDDNRNFAFNAKKMIFDNVICIEQNNISIENMGKGMENLIKTEISLNRNKGSFDVVAIEEPESHLSHINLRKMIEQISQKVDNQMIITTHNNMIVTGLNLKNVIWIQDNKTKKLTDITEADSKFFLKAANNNILQFLLADKIILVEGPTEYILIPKIFEMLFNDNLDEKGIDIISCGGVSYLRYLSLAENLDKKIAVITDNDEKPKKTEFMNKFNEDNQKIKIFMDADTTNWTWEKCFYDLNKEKLTALVNITEGAKYLFNKKDYGPILGKMLNDKVEIAYMLINSDFDYNIPKYVEDALTWIRE